MRKFLLLLDRELKMYFYSPIAYIILCLFLALMGYNLYLMVSIINNVQADFTLVEMVFDGMFWVYFILIVPLLTMRLYSEEFKLGTIETLMTAPVEDWQIVAAKFAGAVMFFVVLFVPTAFNLTIFQWIAHRDSATIGAFGPGYLMLLLMGMFYLSIGCLSSVLTRNQIIAAIVALTVTILVFFTGAIGVGTPLSDPWFRDFVNYIASIKHMRDFSHGLVDTRPIVFYTTATILLQVFTYHVFQYRKWKY